MASHAQKYFIRLANAGRRDKRRQSIHDITSPTGMPGQVTAGRMPAGVQLAMHAGLVAAGVEMPASAEAAMAATAAAAGGVGLYGPVHGR